MQQRIIWFSLFLIALSIAFYFFVIDDQRISRMGDLENSDISLSGDVNSTLEVYSRLEKKWIGTSKHVQTLQEETAAHYEAYTAKMKSKMVNNLKNTKKQEGQLSLEEVLVIEQDKNLRLIAEFDNYKKRKSTEIDNLIKYEGFDFFKSLLSILDDIDRTLIIKDVKK